MIRTIDHRDSCARVAEILAEGQTAESSAKDDDVRKVFVGHAASVASRGGERSTRILGLRKCDLCSQAGYAGLAINERIAIETNNRFALTRDARGGAGAAFGSSLAF